MHVWRMVTSTERHDSCYCWEVKLRAGQSPLDSDRNYVSRCIFSLTYEGSLTELGLLFYLHYPHMCIAVSRKGKISETSSVGPAAFAFGVPTNSNQPVPSSDHRIGDALWVGWLCLAPPRPAALLETMTQQ